MNWPWFQSQDYWVEQNMTFRWAIFGCHSIHTKSKVKIISIDNIYIHIYLISWTNCHKKDTFCKREVFITKVVSCRLGWCCRIPQPPELILKGCDSDNAILRHHFKTANEWTKLNIKHIRFSSCSWIRSQISISFPLIIPVVCCCD